MEALKQASQIWTLKGQFHEIEKGLTDVSELELKFFPSALLKWSIRIVRAKSSSRDSVLRLPQA
jgi:hypothetical protein